MRQVRRLARLLFALTAATLAVGADAGADDLLVRGTVLCNRHGDPNQSIASPDLLLIAVPSLDPGAADLLSSDGLFRLRLGRTNLDRLLRIDLYRGDVRVDSFTEYLEPARVRRASGGESIYVIDAHAVNAACESLRVDPEVAVDALKRLKLRAAATAHLRGVAPEMPDEDGAERSVSPLLYVLGATGVGAALAAGEHADGSPPPPLAVIDTLTVLAAGYPGRSRWELDAYLQQAVAEAPGRTLLSFRHPAEAVGYNPSAGVLGGTRAFAVGAGTPGWARATAAFPISQGAWRGLPIPEYLRIGATGWRQDLDASALLEGRRLVRLTVPITQWAVSLGAARRLTSRTALGISVQRDEFETELLTRAMQGVRRWETGRVDTVYTELTDRCAAGTWTTTVGLTWFLGDRLQGAATVSHLNRPDPSNAGMSPGDDLAWVGAVQWTPARLEAGMELHALEGHLDFVTGWSYRIRNNLAIDAGFGSRFRSRLLGLTVGNRVLSLRAAVYSDAWSDSQIRAQVAWTR